LFKITASEKKPLIGIVGPCGSGKSTLSRRLNQHGLQTRHIAQEHSYVPYMWQRLTHPDVLVFLDASFAVATSRRALNWTAAEYAEQVFRLRHARQHADIYIDTDLLTPDQVAQKVLEHLGIG
jgi:cytidylate kinase